MQWKPCLIAGVGLGASVIVWQIISIPLGLTALFVPVAFLLQIAAVVALLAHARHEHRYGQQLLGATVLSAVASVLIFFGSLLATSVLFPDAIEQLRATTRTALVEQGASQADITAALASITPMAQAWAGVIGTMVSGPFIAALAAIGLRRRASA